VAYYPGDIPSEDLVIEPARNGVAIALAPFTLVEVTLRDPAGVVVESSGFLGTIDIDTVVVEWPADAVLTEAGVYELVLALTNESGSVRERLAPLYLVVQEDAGNWHTLDTAREQWDDAPDDDRELYELLHVAQHAVIEYAPALLDAEPVPLNYVKGQLMQARNVWNSTEVQPSGETGLESYVARPFPLDWQIKQILRPKRAVPWVG